MECTMPTAHFVPRDNAKTLEYVYTCLDEANRGLSFAQFADPLVVKKLKTKIAKISDEVYGELRRQLS